MKNKKISMMFLLAGLIACAPTMQTSRVSLEESDKLALSVTDDWVMKDTELAINSFMQKIENSKPLQRYLSRIGKQPKLFVGEIQNNTSEPYLPINDMNEKFLTALFEQGDFKIVDRTARDTILKEITYQNDGMVNPSQAKKIGKQSGADIIIFGSINMTPKTLQGKTVKEYSVNLRITDIETSDVVFMGTHSVQKFSKRAGNRW